MTIKPHLYRCETCKNTECWLCAGNVYYDKAMANKRLNREHCYEILSYRDFVKYKGCSSHTDSPKWDNRLIWAFEDLLTWLREHHTDQMDIREHVDLILGKYRNELKERQKQDGL